MAKSERKTGLESIENWNNVKRKLSPQAISSIERMLQGKISCHVAVKYQRHERFKEEELAEKKKELAKKGKQNKESSVLTYSGTIPQYCDFNNKSLGEYALGIFFQGNVNEVRMSVRCPKCHTLVHTSTVSTLD